MITPPKSTGESPPAGTPPPVSSPGRVLVVDDVATLRLILQQHVRQLGHDAFGAADGRQALDLLRESRFDLVLLDVMMPEMDGYTVLLTMRADPALRDIPVLVVSGVDDLESVVRCIEAGAEDYLHKPVNQVLLAARVRTCLEKKRLRDQEARLHEELRANYERLKQLEQLRDSLTQMVVHDLRAPLTSLLTGLYTLETLGELNLEQQEFYDYAVTGGESLLGMINDLLDISKMEDGSLRLLRSNPVPEVLIERAAQQVRHLVREQNLTLHLDLPARLPLISADEEMLRRVLVNLLANAVKFTRPGGRVTVSARETEGWLEIAVADTGEGIPREAFGLIFEKFGQVDSRRAGRRNSTGLGLAFCKLAVEAHGGHIGVESELGAGSTFTVQLPIQPRVSPAVAAPVTPKSRQYAEDEGGTPGGGDDRG